MPRMFATFRYILSFRGSAALLLFVWSLSAVAAERPPVAAIASAHPLATAAGREILEAGGNAFDAAVAVAAALAVAEPFASGIGGGGFFLLHRASDGRDVMVDARERAPFAARADMYLDSKGEPLPELSLNGPLAAAIPGLPAGLVHVAQQYGTFPLKRSLAPAIKLARAGVPVTPRYLHSAERARTQLLRSPAAAKVFLDDGALPKDGFVLRQPELAHTLERLAEAGIPGFYAGRTAQQLVDGVRAAGGIWTLKDLTEYRVIERTPLRGRYHGMTVITAPPPSAGGVGLLQMLAMLDGGAIERRSTSRRAHYIIEAMRRAYRDRALYLGDPDFAAVPPVARLLDPGYLKVLRQSIDPKRATPSASIAGAPLPAGSHTTHFSIIDQNGNRVAATLTINTGFGSGFVPPGTGVLLNNEMDDFARAPGLPNVYQLVGSGANEIAPGKRPLSSMTPTFIETADGVVVLGTPGGSRIPSMVLLAALEIAERRGRAQDWVARARFHHQYLPDVVAHEPDAFTAAQANELESYGHRLRATRDRYGNMQVVMWDRRAARVDAASDPRGDGRAWVGGAGAN